MPEGDGPICEVAGISQGSLRVGSCTRMNIASLMVLEWLLITLCTIWNCSESIGCPVVVL